MAKYGPKAQKKVEEAMREMKEGKLHSGSEKGPLVKNPKQAIAIGLSEAREEGAKMPPPPKKSAAAKKTSAKQSTGKTSAKKTSAKKSGAKQSSAKKGGAKKKTASKKG